VDAAPALPRSRGLFDGLEPATSNEAAVANGEPDAIGASGTPASPAEAAADGEAIDDADVTVADTVGGEPRKPDNQAP